MTQIQYIWLKYRILIISLIVLLSAVIIEKYSDRLDVKSINASYFQSVLHKKEQTTAENLVKMDSIIRNRGLNIFKSEFSADYYGLFEKNGIVILAFNNHDLIFWNSNLLPLQKKEAFPEPGNKVINPGNGWYVMQSYIVNDSILLFGLILIKHDYIFENEFLVNDFHRDFNLFPEAGLAFNPSEGEMIRSIEGDYLFSLIEPYPPVFSSTFVNITCLLYLLSIVLILIFLYRSFTLFTFRSIAASNIWLITIMSVLILARYLMLEKSFPGVFESLSLFQPHHYAKSQLFPSLGDFIINAAMILFLTICFSKYFSLLDKTTNPYKAKSIIWVAFLSLALVAFMFFFHYLFSGLIFNSNIQLEVYNFLYLNQFSLVAYLILAILLATLVIFTDKVVFLASTLVEVKSFIIIITISLLAGSIIFISLGNSLSEYALIFFVVLTGSIIGIRYFRYRYTYTFHLYLILLISVFSLAFITDSSSEKERDIRQVLAVNLANERDQIAEFLLEDIETRLREDSLIYASLLSPDHDDYDLVEYLENSYFSGYFRKYELQIASCGVDTDLLLEDVNDLVDCYAFFHEMIDELGLPVTSGSDFYFLDNLNGRISYLGKVVYEFDDFPYEKTLFISFDSKLMSEHLGYPELLLEGKFSIRPAIVQYSNAKYNKEQLITRSGSFPYSLSLQIDQEYEEDFSFVEKGGYEHLVYRIDNDNIIVLSKPTTGIIDLLTSFSYSFSFFYLLYGIALIISKHRVNLRKWRVNFKNKIKYSMIGVLLLSLLIIGSGTIYYNIRQFENKQYESISEKIQSVLVELEYRLGQEDVLTPEMSYYITGLLIQLSNVFNTDINLYDLNGDLYASSRTEVFQLGLQGEQINPQAYSGMVLERNARFVHKESISKLSYLSAYIPFTNNRNQILSYLNLPYFTRQSDLKIEIYTLVVAVVNIYAILILITIIIAIIVSNTITKPLQLIQKRLREVSIGKTHEQIAYDSDDEIGKLIREYNRMVLELENSAALLARSERESAWREMAKQIAHEIKNPLTPMKLSIQHLQRTWDDKNDNWEDVLKKTTRTLVEQIDHLSSIATAFSNFAKLPKITRGEADIISTITNVGGLFSNTENIEISVCLNNLDKLYVVSDKVQLNRVFINLMKNAVQSIPKNRKGKIIIELIREKEMALVRISDNGTGISAEAKDKMFTPNFTTKSGGMGLGLAIVKNIVEQTGGSVGFTSEYQNGSCFYFKLPLAETK